MGPIHGFKTSVPNKIQLTATASKHGFKTPLPYKNETQLTAMGSKSDDDKQSGATRKIMISAIFSLLAVVLLVLLLHLYSRYLLRRRERRRRAALHRLSRQFTPDVADLYSRGEPPKVGLEPSVIASLPAIKYKLDGGEAVECSVCLGTIAEEAMVRVLPNCKHMFHKECVDVWFGSHTTCPLCRTMVQPEEKVVQPSAPPLEETPDQGGGSVSRFGSFRWIVSRERSPRVGSCGEITAQDLERQ